mgnify:FL=1
MRHWGRWSIEMGNAVFVKQPPADTDLSEEMVQQAFGQHWSESLAVRFRTIADEPTWSLVPATPFEDAKWVKADTGHIDYARFRELENYLRKEADAAVNPVAKARITVSILRMQATHRARMQSKRLKRKLACIALIQKTTRGSLVRLALKRKHRAAARIQRVFHKVTTLLKRKAATVIQSVERRRQAKNRLAMQHAKKLAQLEATRVSRIVTKRPQTHEMVLKVSGDAAAVGVAVISAVLYLVGMLALNSLCFCRMQGLILSLPHPWCEVKEAAAAQHVYSGKDESQKVEGLRPGTLDTALNVDDVFVWLFGAQCKKNKPAACSAANHPRLRFCAGSGTGALVQLESLGSRYIEYKEAIKSLLCRSTIWSDGESNRYLFRSLRQHIRFVDPPTTTVLTFTCAVPAVEKRILFSFNSTLNGELIS